MNANRMLVPVLAVAWPRLDVVKHLALYTAFHGSMGNRVAHGLCVPVVLWSMLFLQAYVRVPSAHPAGCLLHLGTALSLALAVVLATVDVLGSLLLLAGLLPVCAAAGVAAASAPAAIVVPAAVVVHLVAWYGTVVIGHLKLEPKMATGAGAEDSNLYFRRGYYVGRGVGVEVHRIDALVQFCIAPLSVAQDALLCVGLRRGLQRAIEAERTRVVARIARDEAPLGEPVP